jgi:hypothetical protein
MNEAIGRLARPIGDEGRGECEGGGEDGDQGAGRDRGPAEPAQEGADDGRPI